jgi:hypothetical protein
MGHGQLFTGVLHFHFGHALPISNIFSTIGQVLKLNSSLLKLIGSG